MCDWLHCNTCYRQPGEGDGRSYYLRDCGHIYCGHCQNKGWKERCLLCDSTTPYAIQLTSNLKPPVDIFLGDPSKLLRKIVSNMKQLMATIEFQTNQRKMFVMHLKKCVSNQETIVQEREKDLKVKISAYVDDIKKNMNKELTQLRNENNYLKRLFSDSYPNQLRSPSGDRMKSPGLKGINSQFPYVSSTRSPMVESPSYKKLRIPGTGMPHSGHEGWKSAGSTVSPMSIGYFGQQTPTTDRIGTPSDINMKTPVNSVHIGQPGSATQGMSVVSQGRLSVRTPPSGGKMGVILNYSTPMMPYKPFTSHPKSGPHPVPGIRP